MASLLGLVGHSRPLSGCWQAWAGHLLGLPVWWARVLTLDARKACGSGILSAALVATMLDRCRGGTVVVTRMWRGWTRSDQADRYELHYRSEVVPDLRQVPGFRGARLLRRTVGEETEFVSLTFFEDLDAVRSFAGADDETAVVAEDARKVLVRFDERVCH
ncbi:MAG TPA: antibiotic biosynthesis monooxygenase [Actinomycetes bacterium]|nr:antibiotic biosynthesis monooxygenase [Actinomycetes bacterium]